MAHAHHSCFGEKREAKGTGSVFEKANQVPCLALWTNEKRGS